MDHLWILLNLYKSLMQTQRNKMKFTEEELNPPKFRDAINAQCRDCIYDEKAGNGSWRNQIELCSCTDCPLYAVRPLTSATTKLRAEARRKYLGTSIQKQAFKPSNKS